MNKNNQELEENFMTRQEVLMTFAQGAKKILEKDRNVNINNSMCI